MKRVRKANITAVVKFVNGSANESTYRAVLHAKILHRAQELTRSRIHHLRQIFETHYDSTQDKLVVTICYGATSEVHKLTAEYQDIMFILKSGCPGFGANHNFAVKAVAAEWYCLSNDDLEDRSEGAAIDFSALQSDKVYSATIVDSGQSIDVSINPMNRFKLFLHIFDLLRLRHSFPRKPGRGSVDGACSSVQFIHVFISRAMFNRYGYLSEITRYWGEDLEFMERVSPCEVVFLEFLILDHERSGSTGVAKASPRYDWALMRLISSLDIIHRHNLRFMFFIVYLNFFYRGPKFRYYLAKYMAS